MCQQQGLTGEQGVIIPRASVKHLMLRRDVVEAAAKKQFHIYPAVRVDEVLEMLTGMEPGARTVKGITPKER